MFYFVNFDQQLRDFPYFVRPARRTFITGACTAPGCAATLAFYNGLERLQPARREQQDLPRQGRLRESNTATTFTVQYNMHRWDSPNGVQTQPVISVAPSANGTDIVKTDFALVDRQLGAVASAG